MNLPDLETVARQVHEDWVRNKWASGITSRTFDQTGEELMVPYDQLTEAAKELDRSTVRTIYNAIQATSQGEVVPLRSLW